MSEEEDEMDLGVDSDDDIYKSLETNDPKDYSKKPTKTQIRRMKRKRQLHYATIEMGIIEEEYQNIEVAIPKHFSKSKRKRLKRNLNLRKAQIVRTIVASTKNEKSKNEDVKEESIEQEKEHHSEKK